MRYLVLACDYDGTLATGGRVDEPTLAALERLLASGRKLVMVTGREVEDLLTTFSHTELFEWIVAENGALLYKPATREIKMLAEPPPAKFVTLLQERGVKPVSVGHAIVATWEPHEAAVLSAIRDLGLELQVIFNKGAVMVLPTGVNKAAGLKAALKEMKLSPHNVVGVGDAENDHAFLALCECSVAVANALPTIKEQVDMVTKADHGRGVTELIDEMIADDLAERAGRLTRHYLLLGHRDDGSEVKIAPHGTNLLLAGPSASGKSTTATALLERLVEHQYQFCIFDPEGDYSTFEGAVTVGGHRQPANANEVLHLLDSPGQNVTVNLTGVPLADRPSFFQTLLSRLLEMRSRLGRPHWLILDEAHHLLPTAWEPGKQALPAALDRIVLITVHPESVSPAVLKLVNGVVVVGKTAQETLTNFCQVLKEKTPKVSGEEPQRGEVLYWPRASDLSPFRVRIVPGKTERRRHSRKYAEGELPPELSFYFRGPEGKLNLRAQNLILFLQMADGVDDETWLHHLRQGDYSRWFREAIKDEGLAEEVEQIEQTEHLSAQRSRALIKEAVERRYTLPASLAPAEAATAH